MAYGNKGTAYGSMKAKSGKKAVNATYSGDSNTMPMSQKSWNDYGLSAGKRTRRSAK